MSRVRRRGLALALAVLLATSGCLGAVSGGSTTFEADPADVDEAAASQTGFEKNGTRDSVVTRELGPEGVSETVRVVNKVTTYEKALEIPLLGTARLGVFSIVSSPAVEVAGQTFNPIADYSNDQLVQLVTDRFGSLSGVERVSSTEITVLGTETRVTKYAATTTAQGQEIEVFVHLGKVRHENDFLVGVGVYPRQLDQESAIRSLFRAVEHPASGA
jgi:hypothetical protein